MKHLIFFIFILLNNFLSAQDIWQKLEQQPDGGTITSVLNWNDSILFAGTLRGCIYKSTNEGQNWNKVFNNSNPNLDKSVEDMVYINEQNIFASITYEGLFKSTDFGQTWNKINQSYGNLYVTDDDQKLFVIAPGSSIIYTTDIGQSWINVVLPDYIYSSDIAISMDNNKWFLTSSWQTSSSSKGVYLSTDSGITWTLTNLNVICNSIVMNDNNEIYVGTNDGIYYSVDFGDIWSIRNQGLPDNTNVFNISLLSDSSITIATDKGVYISSNRGIQWQAYDSLLNKFEVRSLTKFREYGLLFGTKNGVYLNTEFGLNRRSGGISEITINSINQSPNYFILSTELGLYSMNNLDAGWKFIDSLGPIFIRKTSIDSINIYFNNGENFYSSTDEGIVWIVTPLRIGCTAIITFSNHTITIGVYKEVPYLPPSSGLRISNDFGITWNSGALNYANYIHALARNSNNRLFIGIQDMGTLIDYRMYSSLDFGVTAFLSNNGLPNAKINCIEADINDNIYAGTDVGIYKSSDDGNTWELFGLPNSKIHSLKIDSLFNIFVRTDSTIYRSSENGINFNQFIAGLEGLTLSNLLYLGRDNYLYVGTNNGIFRTINQVTSIEDENCEIIADDFELYQNFPNPFNPRTKISYKLPFASNVQLKIFDMLGNEVANLINEEKPAGEYHLEFDGSNLSSGIYFYQIKVGNRIETKKMVLLK